ncbi:MAG TPA: AraC family transcriptional regulator [Candidatus Methylacidiphilales bacterium]|nr:AraC family transcriptional regulator [Candidatus Methylacidiphilales bacterium]
MRNYFDYFPVAPKLQAWGIYSTSFGTVHVPPGSVYPPARHPGRHQLAWEKGRTLAEYQVLFIHKGAGEFESVLTKARAIAGGMAFVLFPGVWHRYRPDPAVGWTESWLEVRGPFLDRLRRAGVLDPRHPVYATPAALEIEQLFEQAATLARIKPPGFTVRLGLLAAEILALLRWSPRSRRATPRRIDELISESQELLAGDLEEKYSLEQIARRLGIGYSYFRRRFKAQTGLSPKQYRIEMRHHRAKNLLLNSGLTVKEISEQLGYSSPFHLSQEFSRIAGVSPQQWRKR